MERIIRPYRESDWAQIEKIHDHARKIELAYAHLDEAFIPLRQAAHDEDLFDYTLFVAQEGDEVVGFVAYSCDELAWLYVDPSKMRRGIGRDLIAHVLKNTTERPLSIEVLKGNEPALKLYLSMGFVKTRELTGKMPGNESFTVTVHCLEKA